jgi:hypothetical protein
MQATPLRSRVEAPCGHPSSLVPLPLHPAPESQRSPDLGSSSLLTSALGGSGCAASGAALGLVRPNKTKCTEIWVDRGESRVSRLRKGLPLAASLISGKLQSGGFRYRVAMVTTTYRPEVVWAPNHIRSCQQAISEYLRRRGLVLRSVWVMELTKRGVPHYHLLIWLPRGLSLPMPDKRGWWPHGSTRIEWARNAVGYLVKYASKIRAAHGDGLRFPFGSRLFGCRGLESSGSEYRHAMRPYWLRIICFPSDRLQRRPGGGWLNVDTGEWLESPYELVTHEPGWRRFCFRLRVPIAIPS